MAKDAHSIPLTKEEVEEFISYNPKTGDFTWKTWKSGWCDNDGRVRPGQFAGDIGNRGYRRICVNYKRVTAHRLAFLVMTGAFPTPGVVVDHINGVRDDNRWSNLRLVTPSQNVMNSKVRDDNTSGCKGVSFCKITGRWYAYINLDGKRHDLGRYDDLNDAIAVRLSEEAKMFGAYSAHT